MGKGHHDAQSGFERICTKLATELNMTEEEVAEKLRPFINISACDDLGDVEFEAVCRAGFHIVRAQKG